MKSHKLRVIRLGPVRPPVYGDLMAADRAALIAIGKTGRSGLPSTEGRRGGSSNRPRGQEERK